MKKIVSAQESPTKENVTSDRFDKVFNSIKKQYKDDYLEGENQVFINTLNKVCKHFDSTYNTTRGNKQ